MTRREFTGMLAALAPARTPRLVAQTYIWTQDLRRRKIELAAGIPELLASTRRAGYRQVELMSEFFTPACRELTLAHLDRNKLTAPIVYFGGALHTREGIDQTAGEVSRLLERVKPAGAVALNHNPNPKPQKALKTGDELALQAAGLEQLNRLIHASGLRFFVHHHDPEMLNNAREWRHILANTPVELCLDADWIHRGGQDPIAILRAAGRRAASLHIRSTRNKVWLESLAPSDIDYTAIAVELDRMAIEPFLVVELADQPETVHTRSLEENLRISREYVQKVFSVAG